MVFCWAKAGAEMANNPAAATASESATLTLDLTSFSLGLPIFVNRLGETLAHGAFAIQPQSCPT
jgi:hypothetical protein